MHELSIALSLVDLACEEAGRLDGARVEALHVRVGVLSGIVADALRFSFDVAAAGTPIEGARLELHDVPATVWCAACQAERTLSSVQYRRCPICDAATPELRSGAELELVSLEVAEDADTARVDQDRGRSPEHSARQ